MTWALKVKHYLDGTLKKFKARFCACGNQRQHEGVNFLTHGPLMSNLAAKMGCKSVQCNITTAFIHAFFKPGKDIFVHQLHGFKMKYGHVLKLKRMMYGLWQAPRYFFEYFTKRLVQQGLTASKYDPCLHFGPNIIFIIYVDNILIYGKDDDVINGYITKKRSEDVARNKEGRTEGYLDVNIKRTHTQTKLMQSGLTKRIISALGLDAKWSTSCDNPAECSPLPRVVNGEKGRNGMINYASVIGMLLYLTGRSHLDCAFATNQCACYTFALTQKHECALIQIGHYLKGTLDKGLILSPSNTLHIDCYPGADFVGLWKYEDSQDPHYVCSWTGYIITLAQCPILWSSKLQSEIALSTTEAEYVALSTSCKNLFPLLISPPSPVTR